MIRVEEALKKIESHIPAGTVKEVEIYRALNHVSAEDIISPLQSPLFDNSAMDGFAVKWEDVSKMKNNFSFQVDGESSAGLPYGETIRENQAIKISTGAMVPEGADTVIPVEDVEEEGNRIIIKNKVKEKQHIRFAGEDYDEGEVIIKKGSFLNAQRLAIIASAGLSKIKVYEKPGVAVITTGSELLNPGDETESGKIFDSNSIMISAAVEKCGGEVIIAEKVEDDLEETTAALKRVEEISDVIIFCGGVSVGPHDHVKEAAANRGFEEVFWKVKQKPGKPLFFGVKMNKLLFGLPGNPVSAFVIFNHYVKTSIQKLSGFEFAQEFTFAKLKDEIINKSNRLNFVRGKLTSVDRAVPAFEAVKNQGSHMLTSIANADGYVSADENEKLEAGTIVKVYLF